MNGTITSYVPEKLYGFIRGVDDKDYFFHRNDFLEAKDHVLIADGAQVIFDQKATPKGYKAVKCALVNPSNTLTFVVPDRVLTSKSHTIKGWSLMEVGDWIIDGEVSNDLDAAKNDILRKAQSLGATALIDYEYTKSTESSGNYYYTVHGFRGRPATVARRHADGTHTEASFQQLGQRLESANDAIDQANQSNQNKVFWLLALTVCMAVALFFVHVFLAILVAGGGLFLASKMGAKRWLHRSPATGHSTSGYSAGSRSKLYGSNR